jgi:hypothetical protein
MKKVILLLLFLPISSMHAINPGSTFLHNFILGFTLNTLFDKHVDSGSACLLFSALNITTHLTADEKEQHFTPLLSISSYIVGKIIGSTTRRVFEAYQKQSRIAQMKICYDQKIKQK